MISSQPPPHPRQAWTWSESARLSSIKARRGSTSIPKIFENCWPIPGSTDDDDDGHVQIETEQDNVVAELFSPVFTLLKIVGFCPITSSVIKKLHENNRRQSKMEYVTSPPISNYHHANSNASDKETKYELSFRSWFFLWTAAVAIYAGYKSILKLLGHADDTSRNLLKEFDDMANAVGPENATVIKSMMWCMRVTMMLLPVGYLVDIFFSWTETTSLAHFLNQWKPFQEEFSAIFHKSSIDFSHLKRRRNWLLLLYVFLPTTLVIISRSLYGNPNFAAILFKILKSTVIFAQTLGASLLEDVKVILSYDVVADGFEQIRNAIKCSMEEDDKQLTPEILRGWRRLVVMMREQAISLGRWQAGHQMFLIGMAILQMTSLSFLFLCGIQLSGKVNTVRLSVQGLGTAFLFFSRIYIKILAAEKISRNEADIASDLECMNSANDTEFENQIEIQFLYDMIKEDPSIVSFGTYVTLNRRLLLGIFSQVVTYLIMIMEFSWSQ